MDDRPVTKGDVIRTCKLKFEEEWKLSADAVAAVETAGRGLTCVHLATDGVNDVIGHAPDGQPVLKSVFLRFDRNLKHSIINHFRSIGFAWVDLVCLNRRHWKIFLFRDEPSESQLGVPPDTIDLEAGLRFHPFVPFAPPEVVMDASGFLYNLGDLHPAATTHGDLSPF